MKYKKSQVTILMIIGLVLFILASLVFYLSKYSVKKQSQNSIRKVQENSMDTQSISQFVSKCIDKVARDAVLLLGRQGGYIYKSEGGTLVDYQDTDEGLFFVTYNKLHVPYIISPQKFSVGKYSAGIPRYPWKFFPYKKDDLIDEEYDGIFGINRMPPLESFGGSHSIQNQIESFIDSNIYGCVDIGILNNKLYNIEVGKSTTNVVVGNNDITIKSSIPMKISNIATKQTTEIRDFSANLDVRIKDVYTFAKDLAEKDTKNIKFNISDINNNKNFISVRLIKDALPSDDLIIITDDKSLIYAKPFEFIFARKNRAPALFYIKNNEFEFPPGHIITEDEITPAEGFIALDPDEDDYVITIDPQPPFELKVPQKKFKIEVSDGKLSDYQIINVTRK